ncbi:MAG: sulfurtransferase complex subunit TusB [Gaiellales bacterium]|nr:MAG: sulfurtransferase complex subunit TusB [Gaiellales bacterium]
MLHLVNTSPFESSDLESAAKYSAKDSPILLFEDGIYAAQAGTAMEGRVKEIMGDHPIYALKADLEARGISNIIDGITEVDYTGFVELVEQHKTASW